MHHPLPSLTWPTAVFRDGPGNSAGKIIRAAWLALRGVFGRLGAPPPADADCEIPERLRDDAGLATREPPRRVEWWEIRR